MDMKAHTNDARSRALCGSAIAVAMLLSATPTLAQDAPATDEAAEETTEVVITGSSIRGIPPNRRRSSTT